MVLFSVQAASSAVTESRLMRTAGAAVDDADGVVGEQGVGSGDVGQVRPDVPVGLGHGGVCHEWAARIAVQGLDGRVFPIYADARVAVRERLPRRRVSYGAYHYSGTRDVYIGYYSRFVKPGGVVGFVVPDMSAELDTLPPPSWPTTRPGTPGICAPSTARYGCGGPGELGLVTAELADMRPNCHDD